MDDEREYSYPLLRTMLMSVGAFTVGYAIFAVIIALLTPAPPRIVYVHTDAPKPVEEKNGHAINPTG